eukprot:6194184-Pyramimonas_sp.AAC.1
MSMLLGMGIARRIMIIMRGTAVMIRGLGYAMDEGYDIRCARASIAPLGHGATVTEDPQPQHPRNCGSPR